MGLTPLVYEMATGQRVFRGESQDSLIAAILDSEPTPISAVQPLTPPALDRVVRKCLEKDPEDRWQAVRDVTGELKWIAESGGKGPVVGPAVVPAKRQLRLSWGVAAVLGMGLVLALVVAYLNRAPAETTTARLSVLTQVGRVTQLALSPDGHQLAFTDGRQLWIWAYPGLVDRLALSIT